MFKSRILERNGQILKHAIALLSGGLDSRLAVLVVLRQGVKVTSLVCLTHFGCNILDNSSCSSAPFEMAERFGFTVKLCHLADKFINIVKNPKYGHGKNMNPCIDCRILMLKEAKQYMKMVGADFLVTGEVLGQRPMSQRRDTFPVIDREAGVQGLVLRPLSAKLLKPTTPETSGMIDREMLFGFSGRSRKPQMKLAEKFGIDDYPTPAGGCLLTDPQYSFKLKDLLKYNPDADVRDINLLKTGRHFRLSDRCKVVIGRNHKENLRINSLALSGDFLLWVENHGSPITLITGRVNDDDIELAASMTARYSDARPLHEVDVTVLQKDKAIKSVCRVNPAVDMILECYRVSG